MVEKLVSGIEYIFKKRNIPMINKNVDKIVKDDKYIIYADGEAQCSVEYVILATGSVPKELPLCVSMEKGFCHQMIFYILKRYQKVLPIGGGVIGCEFASIFAQLVQKSRLLSFT